MQGFEPGHKFLIYNDGNVGEGKVIFNQYLAFALDHMEFIYDVYIFIHLVKNAQVKPMLSVRFA